MIITFCLLSDQIYQETILSRRGRVCEAKLSQMFATVLQCIGYRGWRGGDSAEPEVGGVMVPPLPGAGGTGTDTGPWWRADTEYCQYGSWHSQSLSPGQTQAMAPVSCCPGCWPLGPVRSIESWPLHMFAELSLVSSEDNNIGWRDAWAEWERGLGRVREESGTRSSWKTLAAGSSVSSSVSPGSRLVLLGENQFQSPVLLLSRISQQFRAFSTPFLRVLSSREKGSCSGKVLSEPMSAFNTVLGIFPSASSSDKFLFSR